MAAPSTPPALPRQQAPGERIGRRGAGRGVAGRHRARGRAGRRDGGREPRATDPLGGRPAAGGGADRRRSALLPRRAARRHRGFGDRRLGALHTGPVRRPAGPDPAGPAAPPRSDAPGSDGGMVRPPRRLAGAGRAPGAGVACGGVRTSGHGADAAVAVSAAHGHRLSRLERGPDRRRRGAGRSLGRGSRGGRPRLGVSPRRLRGAGAGPVVAAAPLGGRCGGAMTKSEVRSRVSRPRDTGPDPGRPSPGAGGQHGPALSRVGAVRGLAALRRWQVAHPQLVDALVAVAVFAVALWGPLSGGPGHDPDHHHGPVLDVLTVGVVAVASGALIWRRSRTLLVWAVSLLAAVVIMVHGGAPPVAVVPALVALYTVGCRFPLRVTTVTALVTAAVYGTTMTVVDGVFGDRTATLLAFICVAAAVGYAVRSQRAAVEAAEARARQAEATREEEAERRVTDERLRIARDLHDIVAHHISVVNVQAGVARHLLRSKPDQAENALGLVREASRTVLSEMSTVLGLLRTGEDETPMAPAPGLEGAGTLVESMRRAGLEVAERVEGEPYALPEIANLTAFRVVQESLTNALKHGTGTAELKLEYSPTAVVIEIRNPVRDVVTPSTAGGHGLVGMRERVTSLGGRFTADPQPDGWFTVRAQIPREDRT